MEGLMSWGPVGRAREVTINHREMFSWRYERAVNGSRICDTDLSEVIDFLEQ